MHGGLKPGIFCNRVPGVRIAVEAREVATGDLDPYLMSLFEDIAGGPQVDRITVHLAGFDEAWRRGRLAVTRTDDAIREVARTAVLTHVHEFSRKVGIRRRRGGP